MRRRARSILAVGALLIGGAGIAPIAQAQTGSSAPSDPNEVKVFRAEVTQQQVPLLLAAGQDGHELGEQVPAKGTATVEVYLTDQQAEKLEKQGVDLTEHKLSARAENRVEAAAEGVFRPYSGSGGLQEEILSDRAGEPRPHQGRLHRQDRQRPGHPRAQADQGREEVQGRLQALRPVHVQPARARVDHAGDDPPADAPLPRQLQDDKRIKKIVDSTELWFVLSANPDGYDYTFQDADNRLWRKNLRDNNGDGTIATGDGVDLNRNFAYKWGYDDEGSSPNPTSETYRGASPGLRARDQGPGRLREAHRLHVRHQLPLRRRTPPLRRRLAGGHRHPGRRPLQGARRHPGELRDPRLPPAGLLRAVHHQRRGGRPRGERQRHGDVHPRDVDLPDRLGPRPERRRGTPRTASPSSTSRTTRS